LIDQLPEITSESTISQAQKGHEMLFQKANNDFNAPRTTARSFLITNLAQPAAHASARRLRAPGEPGQRVWRGNSELHEARPVHSC